MNLKKLLCLASIALLPHLSSASVVTVDINQFLPHSGFTDYDIDGDSFFDIGLSEDCCSPNKTFVYSFGPTKWQYSWLKVGDKVDSSLAWVSGTYGYTPLALMLPGRNYLAVSNTSIGNYFGYITIDFQAPLVETGGYTQKLISYTFENSGQAITVGDADKNTVSSPASIGLFGLGLAGLVFGARRRQVTAA